MKALLLLRHADSGDKLQGQTDHERGLTGKGIEQSKAVATFMKEKELRPDQIIASDALRVKSTIEVIVKQLGLPSPVTYSNNLYEAGTDGYLHVVRSAPDCQTLLIAGHNPGITAFAAFISTTKVGSVGTGNLLVLHLKEDSWSKLNKAQCELMEHFIP